jgi:hypothetical protein
MEGLYSASVSNSLGGAISRGAQLIVNDGLVFNRYTPVLDITQPWRYEASGRDLGTAWRFPGFDDSGWAIGSALFAVETPGTYPEPIRTPLTLDTTNGTPISAYYFRTTFADLGAVNGLRVTAYVDDGAVWYVNGREAARLRIAAASTPVDGVAYTNRASNLNNEGPPTILFLPATNLVAGENLLCVQVHQGNLPSSDIVFGMSLESYLTIINQPLVTLDSLQPAGAQLTLTGISGRNYALEFSTNLANWTHLITWTNFTGSALHLDSAAGPIGNRFYRGRLAP